MEVTSRNPLVCFYKKLLEIFELKNTLVICFAEDHGKHAHIIKTFDIIYTAPPPLANTFNSGNLLINSW